MTDKPTPAQFTAFLSRVEFTPTCWLYRPKASKAAYPPVMCGKGQIPAHHMLWNLLRTDAASSRQVLDHLCRRTTCVRPDHLEEVSIAENVQRGLLGVLREECIRGHSLSAENIVLVKARDPKTKGIKLVKRCQPCEVARKQARANRSAARQKDGAVRVCTRGHELTANNVVGKRQRCKLCTHALERRWREQHGITEPAHSPKARLAARLPWAEILSQNP